MSSLHNWVHQSEETDHNTQLARKRVVRWKKQQLHVSKVSSQHDMVLTAVHAYQLLALIALVACNYRTVGRIFGAVIYNMG